jgi:hypothetical protein
VRLLKRLETTSTTPSRAGLRLVRRPGRPELDWECLEPAQFFDDSKLRHVWPPERRLMWAVLADAVVVVLGRAEATPSGVRQEALAWFAAEDHSWPFSFVNVCEAIGVDAVGVRSFLARNLAAPDRRLERGPEHACHRAPGASVARRSGASLDAFRSQEGC